MATVPNTKTVTYEKWLEMPEVDDAVEEVVNGEIRITSPAKWKHGKIVERLGDLIREQIDKHGVKVRISLFGLVIRRQPLTTRVPDLAVFQSDTIMEQDGYIHSAPQLVVEVLSPANTRRERQEKLADYAEIGVPEVWVVSPEGLTVEVLQIHSGRLETVQLLKDGVLRPVG